MLIFSLDGGTDLARALSTRLAQPLADFEDRVFEDGEHKWRPLCDPRAQQVFVLASLHGRPDASPHDALCRLLMFIGTESFSDSKLNQVISTRYHTDLKVSFGFKWIYLNDQKKLVLNISLNENQFNSYIFASTIFPLTVL